MPFREITQTIHKLMMSDTFQLKALAAIGISKADAPKWIQQAIDGWQGFDTDKPITGQVKMLIINGLITPTGFNMPKNVLALYQIAEQTLIEALDVFHNTKDQRAKKALDQLENACHLLYVAAINFGNDENDLSGKIR